MTGSEDKRFPQPLKPARLHGFAALCEGTLLDNSAPMASSAGLGRAAEGAPSSGFRPAAVEPGMETGVEPGGRVGRETRRWYEKYYGAKGDDRNDPLRNPGVLFQNLAFQRSVVEALRAIGVSKEWRILDVGCGGGFSLLQLLTYGLDPEQLYGMDIVEDRIELGRRRFPSLNLQFGDAQAMDFADASFDLAMESTMFVQITDLDMSRRIAQEMLRVVRPGGHILLTDWRYSGGKQGYAALSTARIKQLFEVGQRSRIVHRSHGALIPPLGRTLSKYAPSLYFLTARLFPLAVGQTTVVLQKT